jgi:hypothetical protein
MTNGRISLTKHPLHKESLATLPHHFQNIHQPVSVLSFIVSPVEGTEMPYFVLSTATLKTESTEKPEYVLSRANFNDESTKPDDFVLSKFL